MARQRRAGQTVDDAAPDVERAAEAGMIAEPPAEGWHGPRAVSYTMPFKLSAPDNDLDDPDLPYWLALNRVRGIGPAQFRALLDAFGTAEAAWCGTVAGWRAAGLDTRTASAFERQRHTIVPEAELERLDTLRVWALRITDSRYPRLLREIAMPPALLYVRGTLLPDDDWAVAIVGTRRATTYGRHVTDRLAGELGRQRVTGGGGCVQMLLILLILLILLNEMPPERRVLRKVSRTVRRACCETCGMPHPSGDQGIRDSLELMGSKAAADGGEVSRSSRNC